MKPIIIMGRGTPPLECPTPMWAAQEWYRVPRWKWIKRWRGYIWERWVVVPLGDVSVLDLHIRPDPVPPFIILQYVTEVDRAHIFIEETFR